MKKAESADRRGKETSQKKTENPASQAKALRLEEGTIVDAAFDSLLRSHINNYGKNSD